MYLIDNFITIQESLDNGGTIVSGGGSDIDEKINSGEALDPDDFL